MSRESDNKIIGGDLCRLAELLRQYGLCEDTTALDNAGQSCITSATDTFWSYTLDKIVFKVDEVGSRIPANSEDISVSLSMSIKGIQTESPEIINPLSKLNFDLEIEGFRQNEVSQDVDTLYASWHLDRHIFEAGDSKTKYSHPLYHFTFGGEKMETRGNIFGDAIIMPSPRFAYPPMDAVLGIDFILQNYLHRTKTNEIISEPEYIRMLQSAQERLWKPFFYSIYSFWNTESFQVAPDFSCKHLMPMFY